MSENPHPVLSEWLKRLPTDKVVILSAPFADNIRFWASKGSEEARRHAARLGDDNTYRPEGTT